jgi:hypothetical protein
MTRACAITGTEQSLGPGAPRMRRATADVWTLAGAAGRQVQPGDESRRPGELEGNDTQAPAGAQNPAALIQQHRDLRGVSEFEDNDHEHGVEDTCRRWQRVGIAPGEPGPAGVSCPAGPAARPAEHPAECPGE